MQTIHTASPGPDKTQLSIIARTMFGAPRTVDSGIRIADAKADRFAQLDSPATQQYLPSLLARARNEDRDSADRRKNEFLAMICHELRSPLASIGNAVGILRRATGDDLATQQRMHALIERQLGQMKLLADGLLDVSRITCGKLRLQRERVDLCLIVRNAIETLESDFNQRDHRLAATWPDVPVWLHADARRLEQVFVNLLGNASKYTDTGGELSVSTYARDGRAVVHIRDSGIGIARDVLPHIFDLFVQADEAAQRSRSGLGIGLSLVRTLVELHGGIVTATSVGLGQGSEFTVNLPAET